LRNKSGWTAPKNTPGFSFDYWPEERPAGLFFAVNVSLMGVYGFVTYHALALLERGKQK
jgi:hypothetical protein